ncbi:MAG: hypothetical protein CMJ49_03240 [Planctomycetaceae bacterium]|nr:hypothetical protein [Planctomycetaceae bacterium]
MTMRIGQTWRVVVIGLAVVGAAAGQTQPSTTSQTAEQMMAGRLEQLARNRIENRPDPSAARIEQVLILLDHATRLDDTNAERWRYLIEAIDVAQRDALLRPALEGYLRTSPDDEVAWFRLLLVLGESRQTVEGRLAFYDSLLTGKASDRFSLSVRSRVAYRAALLCREQGDEKGYARELSRSMRLDDVNKEAALEAYRLVTSRSELTPEKQLILLLQVLHADPADAGVHQLIADLMLSVGNYGQAFNWYTTGLVLHELRGRSPSLDMLRRHVVAAWGVGNTARSLELIDGVRQTLEARASAAEAAGEDPTGIATMPLDFQQLLVAIHTVQSQGDDAAQQFATLREMLNGHLADDPEDAKLLMDLVWSAVLFDQGLDKSMAAHLDTLRTILTEDLTEESVALQRLLGWWELRAGRPAEAWEILEPLAPTDPPSALGLCYVLAELGEFDAIGEWLNRVYQSGPERLYGVMAVDMLRRYGLELVSKAEWDAVNASVDRLPRSLQGLALSRSPVVQLRAQARGYRFGYGDPIEIDLVLTNLSEWPLALGRDGTIPTRAFVNTTVESGAGEPVRQNPVVVDMHRQFRLDPGQRLRVGSRIDVGRLGMLLDSNPQPKLRMHVLAVLNPVMNATGGFDPGLLGSQSPLPNIERVAWAAGMRRSDGTAAGSAAECNKMLQRVGGTNAAESMLATARLIYILPRVGEDQQELHNRIAGSIVGAYKRMPPLQQAWTVSLIGNEELGNELGDQGVMYWAARSTDPLVRLVYMATRHLAVEPSFLSQTISKGGGDLRRFAQAEQVLAQEAAEMEASSDSGDGGS